MSWRRFLRALRRSLLQPRFSWHVRARWRRQKITHRLPQLSLLPRIFALFTASVTTGVAARFAPARGYQKLVDTSEQTSEAALQQMQRLFFAAPWLTHATWASGVGLGRIAARAVSWRLKTQIALNIGDVNHARERLERIPADGFTAMMAAYLVWCEAAGYLRAGKVDVQPRWIDGVGQFPETGLKVPLSMTDSLTDIDQMYWAGQVGAVIKIVHVGDSAGSLTGPLVRTVGRMRGRVRESIGAGLNSLSYRFPQPLQDLGDRLDQWASSFAAARQPRWIVSLAGTAHMSPASTENPADTQSNLYEVLGYPSAMRLGIVRAILDAFARAGITDPAEQRAQKVMFIGHSQGAIIAAALAADPEVPFTTVALLSAGGPIGAIEIPAHIATLALRHTQDPVPAMDDAHTRGRRATVVYERSLKPQKTDTLYYSHAASTYAETAALASADAHTTTSPQLARTVEQIESFYPQPLAPGLPMREAARVFIYEATQEILVKPNQLSDYSDEYRELLQAAADPEQAPMIPSKEVADEH